MPVETRVANWPATWEKFPGVPVNGEHLAEDAIPVVPPEKVRTRVRMVGDRDAPGFASFVYVRERKPPKRDA